MEHAGPRFERGAHPPFGKKPGQDDAATQLDLILAGLNQDRRQALKLALIGDASGSVASTSRRKALASDSSISMLTIGSRPFHVQADGRPRRYCGSARRHRHVLRTTVTTMAPSALLS
ncbi:hypothetical protein [Arboricoccus pini]|uniref:hypothetical protein n=1 Tax=Arboricoccus pini TaxID=1963835 RepID=UPI001055D6CF|nr:hypothetical protein [Arboricoccus pini]